MGEFQPDAPANKANHGLPQQNRLRKASDFADVYKDRRTVSDDVLLVFFRPNQLGHGRLGLSVSRKVGNAVRRNRWKRLIREAYRQMELEVTVPFDMIVIPRHVETPTFAMVQMSLLKLVRRIEKRLNKDRG